MKTAQPPKHPHKGAIDVGAGMVPELRHALYRLAQERDRSIAAELKALTIE